MVFYYFSWTKLCQQGNIDLLVPFLARDTTEIRDFGNSQLNDLEKLLLLSSAHSLVARTEFVGSAVQY